MRIIEKCSICGKDVKTKFELEFEDLMGAEEKIYRQKTGICPECGFVFTQNPFTDEQLRSRYKDFSKFEYDDDEYFLDYSYKEQCLRQKNFLYENIEPCRIGSVCEVGAASGYIKRITEILQELNRPKKIADLQRKITALICSTECSAITYAQIKKNVLI